MAKERIISPDYQHADDPNSAVSLRPKNLNDYIGQADLIEKITIALEAASQRGEPMEHVLLHGPPGLGKTTLAHVIAAELGAHAFSTSGPALTKAGDLVGTLTKMQARDILFIDEVHRLPIGVEEYLYSAMEDFKIDFTLDAGLHAKVITYRLQPFTLIGATTRAGLLTAALRTRFGITHSLQYYGLDELKVILHRACQKLQMPQFDDEVMISIARRSRGTPRVTLRLLRRIRDFAQVRAAGRIDPQVVHDALQLERIDELGIDELDRRYLGIIGTTFNGGPVGVEAIAAAMGEDVGTLEDVVEPYLLQIGFLARTRQGRKLTGAAIDHLKLNLTKNSSDALDVQDLFPSSSP